MSGEQLGAVLVALVCALMLGRLLLPAPRRAKLDQAFRRQWALTLSALKRPFRGRAARQAEQAQAEQAEQARQATAAAIERARRASRAAEVVREGNVYKPEAFQKPRKPH